MATKKTIKKNDTSVKDKTIDELKADLLVAQNDLVEAKRSHAARELVNTSRIKDLRVSVARIKTAITARQAENKENA